MPIHHRLAQFECSTDHRGDRTLLIYSATANVIPVPRHLWSCFRWRRRSLS